MRSVRFLLAAAFLLAISSLTNVAYAQSPGTVQRQKDPIPLKAWPAPLYWQPTSAERATIRNGAASSPLPSNSRSSAAFDPIEPLVFVALTPCRVVDTRSSSGFTGAFGPLLTVAALAVTVVASFHKTVSWQAKVILWSVAVVSCIAWMLIVNIPA